MRKYVPVALLVLTAYIVFSGSVSPYDVVLGSLVAAGVSLITSKYVVRDASKAVSLRRFLHLVKYAFYYLTIAEFRAHRMVIGIILSKAMVVNPAIVRVPYRARNEYTIVACANSITNTPGTVVVDIDQEKSQYYVHWIYATGLDRETAYREILEEFEKRLAKVFE
ncbi:MAG: Na+/H+ antiporter subunit E [Sulfolobales archaeon]|nr:Na+/H+ antiporter subunit E [Sulfolobales archaeon]